MENGLRTCFRHYCQNLSLCLSQNYHLDLKAVRFPQKIIQIQVLHQIGLL